MKFIPKFVTVSLLLILVHAVAFAQSLTVDQVLQKMEKANSDYPSLQAKIERTKFVDLTKKANDPQFGTISIMHTGKEPRRIKIDFDRPVREILLIDKSAFWHYYPTTQDGETKSFAKEGQAEGECVFLGLCQSTDLINKFYDAALLPQESIGGVKATVLQLKPKDKKHTPGIASIKLWLDPEKWIPVQTQITQDNKNYTTAKYTEIQKTKLSDADFKLDLPRGVTLTKLK